MSKPALFIGSSTDLILAQIKRQIIIGEPLGRGSLKGHRQWMPFVECNLLNLPMCIDLNAPRDLQRIAHGALNAILLQSLIGASRIWRTSANLRRTRKMSQERMIE